MPILVGAESGSLLRQGDLLRGRRLSFSSAGQDMPPGEFASAPPYLLVISRDCRAIRDSYVAVFQVTEYKLNVSETSFEGLWKSLEVDRDGGRSPDVFYLGPIESGRRFAARMSLPFVIEVPTAEEARAAWVAQNRVATLDEDFLGHLHSRIFGAFARKGFDDYAWLADEDLEVLVRRGEAEMTTLEAEEKTAHADQDDAQLRGLKSKVTKQLETTRVSAAKKLSELRRLVEPFQREQVRRKLETERHRASRSGQTLDPLDE